jgi:tryptophanase
MKLRLEILEILYNFVAASTPVSATVKKFSAGHFFVFLYINCVLPRVSRFNFDFNKLSCQLYSTCLHIRNRETLGYLLLARDDDNLCRLNTV